MGVTRAPQGVVFRGACAHEGIMVESVGILVSATNFAARSLQAIAVARSTLLPTLQYPSRTWR